MDFKTASSADSATAKESCRPLTTTQEETSAQTSKELPQAHSEDKFKFIEGDLATLTPAWHLQR